MQIFMPKCLATSHYVARKGLRGIALSLLFTILFTLPIKALGGEFMGLFNNKKEIVYPFSGFDGQLLYKGEPAAGAQLTRSYDMFGEKFEETIIADEEGRFAFTSIAKEFRAPLFSPVEFLVHQEIFVDFKSKRIQIWGTSKRLKGEYSEFNGKSVFIRCEITEEPRAVERSEQQGLMVTNFYWE